MSKLQRPAVTPPDFDSQLPDEIVQPHVDDESIGNAGSALKQFAEADEAAKPKDLAKVMTNDHTPRCPFCKSPRLEKMTFENLYGRKWVCLDCCTQFREPITGRAA
jgi:transposase-like protein